MSILSSLFGNSDLHRHYSEIESLKEIRNEFEHYIYNIYEKVKILCEIMNKHYDIDYQQKGYIWEDEKVFNRGHAPNGSRNLGKDRKVLYYKSWINRRLKQVIKIVENSAKSKLRISKEERNLIHTLQELKNHFGSEDFKGDNEAARHVIELLERLERNNDRQRKILLGIYPIKEWNIDIHSTLISEEMVSLIRQEISIVFESRISTGNYNEFQAIISRAIHENRIPADSMLRKLIDTRISKVNEKRREGIFNVRKFYHARPMTVTGDIFPLSIDKRKVGLFIDSDYDETIRVVKSLYHIMEHESVTVFELEIPGNLMKHCIPDTFDERMLQLVENMDHSYIVRPTSFPIFNEFYKKGLIKVKRIR